LIVTDWKELLFKDARVERGGRKWGGGDMVRPLVPSSGTRGADPLGVIKRETQFDNTKAQRH
jgi:hypothetical protein